MSLKIWKVKEKVPEDIVNKLKNFSTLQAHLLYYRGLEKDSEIQDFLNPRYEKLHSPFLFTDMQKATARIWQAIENKEGICIYGDYDADAVTANAVLRQTFKFLGVVADSYIPDRFTEGYGLNLEAFEKIKNRGNTLVITVDCGTNSVEVAEWCKRNNIDLIITDHHEIIGDLPSAFALINPKNPKDNYPFSEITGVGVAFKLACGILNPKSKIQNSKSIAGWEKWLLDLVAIGTVADCHTLLGENRILVKYGLVVLKKTKWPGLSALMKTAGIDPLQKPLDTYTLGFLIAPRLNAAGRLEHANLALDLLLEENEENAQKMAENLNFINQKRQLLTDRVLSEAKEQAEFIKDRKVLILMKEDWPKGVVGLVAGKLVEIFCKPVMVLEKTENQATGSARTVGEFNVVESLVFAKQHLTRFGGHKQAAGLTLHPDNFEVFYQKVLEYAEQNLKQEDLVPLIELETELKIQDISFKNIELIKEFEPFGVGNPRPKFLIKNLKILKLKAVGKQNNHLQIFSQKENLQIPGIAFGQGFLAETLKVGDIINVACELMEDVWNGTRQLKLRIFDIRLSGNDII